MSKTRYSQIGFLLSTVVLMLSPLCALTWAQNVSLENEYIKITVNARDQETGRFSVDTTGGDPKRREDDEQNLIYGSDEPWTSFTTVQIDGLTYVFGGPTQRRAGQGKIGIHREGPRLTEEGLVTTYSFGAITVTQVLSFAYSPTSGLLDTAKIKYRIENTGTSRHQVGLRIMLDTMLGDNDGAPFRVGEAAITTATTLTKGQMPDFWQAFDSLVDLKVIAQGTLRGGEVTPPDRVVFLDWGTAADALWDVNIVPGADFTRKDEDELDSAIALYWDPVPLAPSESKTIITYYGLGGIDLMSGTLALGLTAPAEVSQSQFTAIGYVQNTGTILARDVSVRLDLPHGLSLAEGALTRTLGDLEPGQSRQVVWQISVSPLVRGIRQFSMIAEAQNCERNQVSRRVSFVGPPNLNLVVTGPPSIGIKEERWHPYPAILTATISNRLEQGGTAQAQEVWLVLELADGLALAPGEISRKYVGYLDPSENFTSQWAVVPQTPAGGIFNFKVRAEVGNAPNLQGTSKINVSKLVPRLFLQARKEVVAVGGVVIVDVWATNVVNLADVNVGIVYDANKLKLISVSKGTLFPPEGENIWGEPQITAGQVFGLGGEYHSWGIPFGTIARLNFQVLQPGNANVALVQHQFKNKSGDLIPVIRGANLNLKLGE